MRPDVDGAPIDASVDPDAPYHHLAELPRTLWLGSLTTACGDNLTRLRDVSRWLEALLRAELPPLDADWGDPEPVHALRRAAGELRLPTLAAGLPAVAEQVIRTCFWHLDHLIDRPQGMPRAQAIADMVDEFKAQWTEDRNDWDEVAALLRGLGDLSKLSWDALTGRRHARALRGLAELGSLVASDAAIVALLQRLGRGVSRERVASEAPPKVSPTAPHLVPVVWRTVTLPDAPGDIHGTRLGDRLSRMVPAEAASLRHPVLRKLWRARLAESRLQVWDESARWQEAIADPSGPSTQAAAPSPQASTHGPMIVCVDTSGSMRGAPERLAKAIVVEAVRVAHANRRGCFLVAFGGAGELASWTLDFAHGGFDHLMTFIEQVFDGGTDIASPLELAIERVHEAAWQRADVLIVSDGEFGATPAVLARLDAARARLGLRVQGLLIGDRETMGLLEVCDDIHWVRDWRRFDPDHPTPAGFSPVHSQSLTALYFPNALSERAASLRARSPRR